MRTEINYKKAVASRVEISQRFLEYLLKGERNTKLAKGKKLAKAIGGKPELWIFGTAKQRQAAWKKALKKEQTKAIPAKKRRTTPREDDAS